MLTLVVNLAYPGREKLSWEITRVSYGHVYGVIFLLADWYRRGQSTMGIHPSPGGSVQCGKVAKQARERKPMGGVSALFMFQAPALISCLGFSQWWTITLSFPSCLWSVFYPATEKETRTLSLTELIRMSLKITWMLSSTGEIWSQRDSSVGEVSLHQGWWLDFNPQNPHNRRQPNPAHCPLTSTLCHGM